MLQALFINAIILIAMLSIQNQVFKNKEISPSAPLRTRVFFGVLSGFLGILLMLNTVMIMPGIILDFRNIAIILSAAYGGCIAAILTSVLIAIFRLLYFGYSFTSVVASAAALLIGLGSVFVLKIKLSNKRKWLILTILTLIICSSAFIIIVPDRLLILRILLINLISTSVVSYLVYKYVNYLHLSNLLFRKYKEDSSKDYVTGLNNVRQFDIELNKLIESLKPTDLISMLLIDIDYFKKVNDRHGHLNGNKILEDFGNLLQSLCRESDIISRNGGEEFTVLLLDSSRNHSLEIAERIRQAVEDFSFVLNDGQTIKITISIGVATYPDSVDDISNLLESADSALYEAKKAGRNKVFLAR